MELVPEGTLKQEEDASEAETAEPETPAAEATVEVEAENHRSGRFRIRRRVNNRPRQAGGGGVVGLFLPPGLPLLRR